MKPTKNQSVEYFSHAEYSETLCVAEYNNDDNDTKSKKCRYIDVISSENILLLTISQLQNYNMEANKLDALECLRRAELLLNTGLEIKRDSVLGLLKKSIRLYPTEKAKKLLDKVISAMASEHKRLSDDDISDSSDVHKDHHQPNASNGRRIFNDDSQTRSDDQRIAMERVLNEISKSYRKLALLLHPDKNRVTGSADCFKAVARAFKILGDSKSRAEYDLSLSNPLSSSQRRHGSTATVYRCGSNLFNVWSDDDDFSAEEFFNAFFARPSGFASPTRFTNHHRSPLFQSQNSLREDPLILKYIAMGVLMMLMFFTVYMVPNQSFRFAATSTHSMRRTTSRLKVPYFVEPKFSMDENELQSFEYEVENIYLEQLKRQCSEENQNRIAAIARARIFGSINAEKEALQMQTPSCDIYRSMSAKAA
ncbi:hypothetical protein GJ496_006682 [Pomphorhynchus laevis]|nr:hypothetical protein GJ496_006682 [Pomphorhynchus laevis]